MDPAELRRGIRVLGTRTAAEFCARRPELLVLADGLVPGQQKAAARGEVHAVEILQRHAD